LKNKITGLFLLKLYFEIIIRFFSSTILFLSIEFWHHIRFTEFALKENSEEEKELHKNVKRLIEVIVGLLKDRVDVEKEPAMKKQRV
jgi:hypothetical protein